MTVRKTRSNSRVPMAVAAAAAVAVLVCCSCSGADAFLVKPFTFRVHHPTPSPLAQAHGLLRNGLFNPLTNLFGDDFGGGGDGDDSWNALARLHRQTLANAFGLADTVHQRHAQPQPKPTQKPVNTQPKAKAQPKAEANADAAAAPAAVKNHFRSRNRAYDAAVEAQLQRWRCAAHCTRRQQQTLPYEATFTERVVDANPIRAQYVEAVGGVDIVLELPQVKPEDVRVDVDVDRLTITAERAPRPASSAQGAELDELCACSGDDDSDAESTSQSVAQTVVNGEVTESRSERSSTSGKRESVSRTYQLGAFVPTEHITATVTTKPADADADADVEGDADADGEFVTVLTVRVPNGSRPGVKHVAITSVDSETAATARAKKLVAALAAPNPTPLLAPATEPLTDASTARVSPAAAAEAAPATATATTTAAPATAETAAPAPAAPTVAAVDPAANPNPLFAAAAAPGTKPTAAATADGADDVLNL